MRCESTQTNVPSQEPKLKCVCQACWLAKSNLNPQNKVVLFLAQSNRIGAHHLGQKNKQGKLERKGDNGFISKNIGENKILGAL